MSLAYLSIGTPALSSLSAGLSPLVFTTSLVLEGYNQDELALPAALRRRCYHRDVQWRSRYLPRLLPYAFRWLLLLPSFT